MSDISNTLNSVTISKLSKEEIQTFVNSKMQSFLPDAINKVQTALNAARNSKEMLEAVKLILDYSGVYSVKDKMNAATGFSAGVNLSGELFGAAFKAMAEGFGVVKNDLKIELDRTPIQESEEVKDEQSDPESKPEPIKVKSRKPKINKFTI